MSKPQTPDYTEISATIEATPANVMGAMKQDVSDLGAYLNNTPAIHIKAFGDAFSSFSSVMCPSDLSAVTQKCEAKLFFTRSTML